MARPTNTKALLQAEKAIEEAQARRDQLLQGFHLKAGERLVDLLGVEGVDDALAALEKGLKGLSPAERSSTITDRFSAPSKPRSAHRAATQPGPSDGHEGASHAS